MTKRLSINYLNKGNDSVLPTPREKTPTIEKMDVLPKQKMEQLHNRSNFN